MSKCGVIACLWLALDANAVVEHHPIAARVLLLVAIFASGCFEAFVLKLRNLACSTWFICLGALTAWIAYSWTDASILAGAVVFASGLILLIIYYRSSQVEQEPSKTKAKT
jgi:hypothetical protein